MRRGGRGFTLLDIMIVVVILGILAAATVPLVSGHVARARTTTAQSNHAMVRKALDLYFQRHARFPDEITPELFVEHEPVTMPLGYQLRYDPASGVLDLLEVVEQRPDDEPDIVLAE